VVEHAWRRIVRDALVGLFAGLAAALVASLGHADMNIVLIAGIGVCMVALLILEASGFLYRRQPLVVKVKESRFENWRHIALIAAFHVEITNTTGKPTLIASYGFTTDNRGKQSWEFSATGEDHIAVMREVHARQEGHRYGPSLRIHAEVPAHESVSGWLVHPVTRDPAGGTPKCTIVVKDDIGNEYRKTIKEREPKTY